MSRENMNKQQKQVVKLTREQKARQIFESGLIENIGSDFYSIKSQTNKDKEYCVDIINNSCSCKDSELGNTCKHFIAVNLYRVEKIKQALITAQVKAVRKITVGVVQ